MPNEINQSLEIKKCIASGQSILDTLTDNDFLDIFKVVYQVSLENNARFELSIALLEIKSIILEIEVEAQGDNSFFEIRFLYALSSDQNITIITKQKHTGKKTVSRFYARGIVKDQARVTHEGLIFIDLQAQGSDAELNHTTIVLDGKPQVILIPSIEVLNHDVQCCHGAAVGQFDEQHLWYLKTRGFDKKEAYHMLAKSFFGEFIQKFDKPEMLLESLCQKIL